MDINIKSKTLMVLKLLDDDSEGTRVNPICEMSLSDTTPEVQANANLIAAAPELLEALEQTLSCIDQHTDDPILGPIIEQARQAITKAKGDV